VTSRAEVSDDERLRVRAPPPGFPVMRQVWRHLAFLHWPVDAGAVARLLPPGLEVDTYGGAAYVGIVPFTIPRTFPPLLRRFHEVNVRTYVHRRGCDPGVWFFSLDAASRLAVAGARLAYHLPYFHAEIVMKVEVGPGGEWVAYAARRSARRAVPPRLACRYAPTGPVAPARPGTLELFLVERYLLYAWDGRRLRAARVAHAPYPLQTATAEDVAETLTTAAGLPRPDAPPLAHYAREVDVRIYAPHRLAP